MVDFFLANHTVDTVMGEIFNNGMDIARTGWIENNIAKFLRGDEKIKIFKQKSSKVAVRAMKREEEQNEAMPIAKYINFLLLENGLSNAAKRMNVGWLQKDSDGLLLSHLTGDGFRQKVNSTFYSKKMKNLVKNIGVFIKKF